MAGIAEATPDIAPRLRRGVAGFRLEIPDKRSLGQPRRSPAQATARPDLGKAGAAGADLGLRPA